MKRRLKVFAVAVGIIVAIGLVLLAVWHYGRANANLASQSPPNDEQPKVVNAAPVLPPVASPARRSVSAEHYIAVIRDTLQGFDELPKDHVARLEKSLASIVRSEFDTQGVANDSEEKFARFKEGFASLITLKGTGIAHEPSL